MTGEVCIRLATAVFKPENEKSKLSEFIIGLGNLILKALPCEANLLILGPPGYGRPKRRAHLSKHSPAASSLVPPKYLYLLWYSNRTKSVCPPETSRPIHGKVGFSGSCRPTAPKMSSLVATSLRAVFGAPRLPPPLETADVIQFA